MGIQTTKCIHYALCGLARFGQYHTDPLSPLHQLHHQRRTADHINHIAGIIRRVGYSGNGQVNSLSRQQL